MKILTCVGDGESEHLSGVFVLLSKLPEDIAFSFSGKSVLSLGGVQDVYFTEGVGNVDVSVDGEGHHGSGGVIERGSGGLRSGDLNNEYGLRTNCLYNYLALLAGSPNGKIGGCHQLDIRSFSRVKRHGCFRNYSAKSFKT